MMHYRDNYCQINYNPITNQVYLKWILPPDEQALVSSYSKGFDMAISTQAASWVSDNSIGFQVNISMQRALAQLTASRLKHTSLKRFARVTPVDVFQELVTHSIFNQVNELTLNPLEFEVFHNPQDAQTWCTQSCVFSRQ